MTNKVWFITGSSKGFGRVWAEAALARGDRVAATARDTGTLADLVAKYGDNIAAIKLDVSDKKAVDAAVAEAHKRFGRLDVVINNAGYGHFGAIEEVSEQEARDQIETNVFGALWVTQAALIGGVNAFASLGLYHASKWALEAFSQSLSLEVAEFGIHVTLVEPGGFSTDWAGPSAKVSKEIEAYAPARAAMEERRSRAVAGDPEATGPAMLAIVDAAEPPLRVFFGDGGLPMIKQEYANRIATWEKWDHVSVMAQGANKNRKA
ncbi:SDR family oxidoreductase [Mesorhizobium sp. ESP-6-2]|uniref:SDR family oxidoreductase n=1 Tax=Mesorhizobium sp. ESP-6-2 TaxID=2876625 RepID=UPI001CC9E239|nr:SDR family oxidoreductase [Mesorhizobium sp. ESP-6-2]MBZ9807505.1 SDR family oxidoreductase [Mesorhizobium sp. ESP-6-2]